MIIYGCCSVDRCIAYLEVNPIWGSNVKRLAGVKLRTDPLDREGLRGLEHFARRFSPAARIICTPIQTDPPFRREPASDFDPNQLSIPGHSDLKALEFEVKVLKGQRQLNANGKALGPLEDGLNDWVYMEYLTMKKALYAGVLGGFRNLLPLLRRDPTILLQGL